MKRNLKIYFTKALIMCALTITVASCAKDKELPAPTQVEKEMDVKKFERIQKFISIAFGIPVNEQKYDKVKEEYTIYTSKMSRAEMEKLYDGANEYKFKHEN
ncbi:hypothetical protein [Pedobacter caeni]|uniref:DUF4296 domain-containing protein n=1 Tax=Pedobacter caeni TaxID=288992 RepID=A0A1M5IY39_9SPHI|nr:hypothetical protein [Pedobacter caeni]SHG32880.1 hypothetical protein SAMN04488522_105101 [Pedobacter caeni]